MTEITKPIKDYLVQDPEMKVGDNSSEDGSPNIAGPIGDRPIFKEETK